MSFRGNLMKRTRPSRRNLEVRRNAPRIAPCCVGGCDQYRNRRQIPIAAAATSISFVSSLLASPGRQQPPHRPNRFPNTRGFFSSSFSRTRASVNVRRYLSTFFFLFFCLVGSAEDLTKSNRRPRFRRRAISYRAVRRRNNNREWNESYESCARTNGRSAFAVVTCLRSD